MILPGSTNTGQSGRIIGGAVRNGFSAGFELRASNWILNGCRAEGNASVGFYVYTTQTSAVIEALTLQGCVSKGNGSHGFYVNGTVATIGRISVDIIGGASIGNAQRGIYLNGSSSTATVKLCSLMGVLSRDNGSNSQQIHLSGAVDKTTVSGCRMAHT